MSRLRDIELPGGRRVPSRALSVSFSRSSGPGGQNVNKVATKVDLRLDLDAAADGLSVADRARITRVLANRLDAEGRVWVISSEAREQARNIELALIRLQALLAQALARPKRRRPTKPTASSKRKRVQDKRHRSSVKKSRGRVGGDDH